MNPILESSKTKSFAELLDDNLSDILIRVENLKNYAYRKNDNVLTDELSDISKLISKLYDARIELYDRIVTLKN